MFHTRTTKTASGATAVQVVSYTNRKTIVHAHIGSTHEVKEIALLQQAAKQWITQHNHQGTLFPSYEKETASVLVLEKSQYLGVRYSFIYEVLSEIFRFFEFHLLANKLLLDLVVMRIIHPVSKRESLEYLADMFGIIYKEGSIYQAIPAFAKLKSAVEKKTVAVAKTQFAFDFSIVFYDVTTLYFEAFIEDEDTQDPNGTVLMRGLRKNGFSKDNKANQPQIVIGLIVTREGFPVSYEVFSGNTFEGKTFIPAIIAFKETYQIDTLTIVADAAMISFDNVEKLKEKQLSYIVGARVANLQRKQIEQINRALINQQQDILELQKRDGMTTRIQTERGLLICDFSWKRYQKDKREMEKQIARAKKLLDKKDAVKRTKFLMNKDKKKTEHILNIELVEKTTLLLGIKGYYTNLTEEPDTTIIDHYHNLWHVEHAFRISKSDLAMRPIYHFKKQTIEAHILICFMALAVCKYMELKTDKSTKKIIKMLRNITDARILDRLTGKEIVMRQELPEDVAKLWKTLTMSY